MGKKIINEWKNKRIFRTEHDRFKQKKYIYNSFIKTSSNGFNSKSIYPYIFTDIYSKYYRYTGYDVMYPVGFNDINEHTFLFAKDTKASFNELSTNFKYQLSEMGIGYDESKEIILSDHNYISFVQRAFLELYNKEIIYFKNQDTFTDFTSKNIYNNYEVKKEGNRFYLIKTNEEVYIKKQEVLVLNIKSIQENLMSLIQKIDFDKEVKNEVLNFFDFQEGLKINLYSKDKDISLTVKLDSPELLAGVSFIALNPKYMDITQYASSDEKNEVLKYQTCENSNDCFTGIILKNPLNNNDIYVFGSYKYNEDIHIGIPSVNENDFEFASNLGVIIYDILESDYMINSDFLTGMKKEEAKNAIIEAFTSEEMGSVYYASNVNEIIISSNDDFGLLVPVMKSYDKLVVLDSKHYPVYYSNRYRVVISNDESLEAGVVSKIVFNDLFLTGLNNIYAKVYDSNGGNNDFFEGNNIVFNNSLCVVKDSIIEECAMPLVFNLLFNSSLNNTLVFDKVIYLRNLIINESLREEYVRLNINFVDEVINRTNSDAYRLYLLISENIYDDLGKTLEAVKEWEGILEQIKNIYLGDFKIDVYKNLDWDDFIKKENEYLNNFDLKGFTKNLIEFFNGYILTNGITIVEAKEFLVLLSLICPFLAEEINKDIFIERYSVFYNEWPK